MRVVADYHTHTVFSHGKGSIEDNVIAARKKGLKCIGISDHGSGHFLYGVKRNELFNMRSQIEILKKRYTDIEILLGIEANIINESGALDYTKEELSQFDYVMAGYHFGVLGEAPANALLFHTKNYLGIKDIKKNTRIIIKAIESNQIKIITHPGSKGAVDIMQIANVCSKKGVLLEVSSHHSKLSVGDLKLLKDSDVRFILGSDAHRPEDVGNFDVALKKVLDAGIDPARIDNILMER